MTGHLLFVYGTLKRGCRAHHLITDQQYLGEAITDPNYRLYDLGRYPGLVPAADGAPVRGELWAVSECCLEELDDYEGVPELFVRGPVEVAGRGGVQAYFYARPVPPEAPAGECWPVPRLTG